MNDSTTELVFRIEWSDGTMRSGAIQLGAGAAASLRIGSEVLVRTDGDRVALDVDGMASAPLGSKVPGLHHRTVPDVGVDDTALDMRVLSNLKKWTPGRAVVQSWSRCSTLGMATDNWDVVLTLPDGTTATDAKDAVPTYARWFVVPGAEVPVVIDPKHPDNARVDWPHLAEERAGGQWDDPVPDGSIAAARLADRATPMQSTVSFGARPDPTPPVDDGGIEGVTLETWAAIEAGLIHDRVPPAGYDAWATEHFGVPEGRWGAIVKAWHARQASDWRISEAFGPAFRAAQKELKRKK